MHWCSYYLALPVSVPRSAAIERLMLVGDRPSKLNLLELAEMVLRAVSFCNWAGVLVSRSAVISAGHTDRPYSWRCVSAEVPSEDVQGACIVVAGNLLQFSAHRTLSRLSTADATDEGKEAYRLPRGNIQWHAAQ